METIGVAQAQTHFSRLLRRVAQGESVTITKRGHPVARLVPVAEEADKQERAQRAADRMRERRQQFGRAPLAELIATIHEGHRY